MHFSLSIQYRHNFHAKLYHFYHISTHYYSQKHSFANSFEDIYKIGQNHVVFYKSMLCSDSTNIIVIFLLIICVIMSPYHFKIYWKFTSTVRIVYYTHWFDIFVSFVFLILYLQYFRNVIALWFKSFYIEHICSYTLISY